MDFADAFEGAMGEAEAAAIIQAAAMLADPACLDGNMVDHTDTVLLYGRARQGGVRYSQVKR